MAAAALAARAGAARNRPRDVHAACIPPCALASTQGTPAESGALTGQLTLLRERLARRAG